MSAEVAQVLRAALERLDGGKRWIKGNFHDDAGNYCSIGAIDAAIWAVGDKCNVDPEDRVLAVVLAEYPDRQPADVSIAKFNDHPATTFADVERVFEKAIANADES